MLVRERASSFDDEAAPLTMPAWVASDGAFVLDIVLWKLGSCLEDAERTRRSVGVLARAQAYLRAAFAAQVSEADCRPAGQTFL